MTSAINRLKDGTIELTITIPWEVVSKTHDEIISQLVRNAQVPGFRKGKASKKIIENQLDEEKVREDVLKQLLPKMYIEAVEQHKLKPIINPKIHVQKLEEQKDWQFVAITCELPELDLNNYKDAIFKVTAKSKIIVPGKAEEKPKFDEILKALLDSIQIKLPNILVEGEVDRLLSQMLSEVKSLGLTLERYLASTGRTTESLREEYMKKATNDLALEFALAKISEVEKIVVSEKEIDEAINKAKTDEERKNLETNRYLLARILRQQKTIDFLTKL